MKPLVAEDIADCIVFAVTRPPHVDIDEMVIRPAGASGPVAGGEKGGVVFRTPLSQALSPERRGVKF